MARAGAGSLPATEDAGEPTFSSHPHGADAVESMALVLGEVSGRVGVERW